MKCLWIGFRSIPSDLKSIHRQNFFFFWVPRCRTQHAEQCLLWISKRSAIEILLVIKQRLHISCALTFGYFRCAWREGDTRALIHSDQRVPSHVFTRLIISKKFSFLVSPLSSAIITVVGLYCGCVRIKIIALAAGASSECHFDAGNPVVELW